MANKPERQGPRLDWESVRARGEDYDAFGTMARDSLQSQQPITDGKCQSDQPCSTVKECPVEACPIVDSALITEDGQFIVESDDPQRVLIRIANMSRQGTTIFVAFGRKCVGDAQDENVAGVLQGKKAWDGFPVYPGGVQEFRGTGSVFVVASQLIPSSGAESYGVPVSWEIERNC